MQDRNRDIFLTSSMPRCPLMPGSYYSSLGFRKDVGAIALDL